MTTRAQWIEDTLRAELAPSHLEITDESAQHAGDRIESHFRVVVVSDRFDGLPLIRRHRLAQDPLKPAFEQGLHALALHTYSPAEWAARQDAPASPACQGGGH
ncbi:BolA/IbaG family iron-sulfur metabolism protein [Guyparkeria hydrothermalis]|uniref:BolA/IbaG family iron-sulfur metabolism protein n=1 Tax=Guyparkeria halophila TaxID=47960 RepID=A0A6I6D063_9GAMM|nr:MULTISPECIES: BolA family protein [Guyparkeria]MCL7750957.1 BolA/IbaG family iron-sulfur metabolism protein [Guyparkeria hydrothermalis]QGT77417.1 BolA/IbaG family iron-sulfur metabolism protein [Guyparkeria halophila]TKA88671.1 BolA family transcriptional regulator [Guyparkeria sp. SB14A]